MSKAYSRMSASQLRDLMHDRGMEERPKSTRRELIEDLREHDRLAEQLRRYRVVAVGTRRVEGVAYVEARNQAAAEEAANGLNDRDFEWITEPFIEGYDVTDIEKADW